MSEIRELRRKIQEKRYELHNAVDSNFDRLLAEETYELSVELDRLIVKVMQKELRQKTYN
ncbi:Spo0E like sporulation regulatory protein [Desulfonispora thiosulfatigenes DSM 11270]|uniref:Spo0E like sporulation regulatory protein n=1 Tax=Desulfonispora thiosulfatigenes DSM 11270 TaxID=656914 RepID=A0A1W1UXL9_DESTI|nr:aspartyl-phosphate phosphatase Spo0E family protein [Desulfonispora thiosulfatigenes]SMB85501.1 Spo0E like sporulation regulatory protein [Desulfonispora thiosulfatigenes DSM 11270]